MSIADPAMIRRPETIPTGLRRPVGESLPMAAGRIARELQPEKIILFGSYAYGQPTPDSDVDLLVILDTNLSPRERYSRVSQLLAPRLFPVDIVVRTPEEVRRALEGRDSFITEIVREGVVLYERSG